MGYLQWTADLYNTRLQILDSIHTCHFKGFVSGRNPDLTFVYTCVRLHWPDRKSRPDVDAPEAAKNARRRITCVH